MPFAKCLLTSIGIAMLATPALSQQFYIVRDAATNQCAIAQQWPAEGAGTVVGDGAYAYRDYAEAEMRAIYACMWPAPPPPSDQFYIVQNATTNQCAIAQQWPAAGAGTVVGEGAYAYREYAEADMRSISACMGTPTSGPR